MNIGTDERIIIDRPTERSGVYAIFNPIAKKVYIGETMDFYRRLVEHIRSIYGLESSSNKNLEQETSKTFDIFPVIQSKFNKKNNKENNRIWIMQETAVMYVFRKKGFSLYNSPKDNTGLQRSFLFEDISGAELKARAIAYFDDSWGKNAHELVEAQSWDAFFNAIEHELQQIIYRRFSINLDELSALSSKDARSAVWKNRLQKLKDETGNYYIINSEKDVNRICNKLLAQRLSILDMKQCGLSAKDPADLAEQIQNGELDRIIVSKFGHYLEQGPMTILSTKVYDINHNSLETLSGLNINADRKDLGICFWALKNLNIEYTRKILSFDSKDTGPRYAILLYTPSDKYKITIPTQKDNQQNYPSEPGMQPGDNYLDYFNKYQRYAEEIEALKAAQAEERRKQKEKIDNLNIRDRETLESFHERMQGCLQAKDALAKEKFAFGYASDFAADNSGWSTYPKEMFPEVVLKAVKHSVALLISELSFVDANYQNPERFFEFYVPRTKEGTTTILADTFSSAGSHACAELEPNARESLIQYFINPENLDTMRENETSFLIARLEYPYIVALADDPIE